jgi:hypothetical protein
MTPEQIVALATAMRAAGVSYFSYEGLKVRLLPPPPKPMDEIRDRIAEMTPEERLKLVDSAKKDLEEDLYGSSR